MHCSPIISVTAHFGSSAAAVFSSSESDNPREMHNMLGCLVPMDRSDRAQHISGRNTIVTSVKEVNTSRCWCLKIFKLGKARYELKLGAPAGATTQTAVERVADRDGTGTSTNGRSQRAHGSQPGCASVKATSVQLRRSQHATVGHAGHRPTGAPTVLAYHGARTQQRRRLKADHLIIVKRTHGVTAILYGDMCSLHCRASACCMHSCCTHQ